MMGAKRNRNRYERKKARRKLFKGLTSDPRTGSRTRGK